MRLPPEVVSSLHVPAGVLLGVSSNLCDTTTAHFPPLREHLTIYPRKDAKDIVSGLMLNLPSSEFARKECTWAEQSRVKNQIQGNHKHGRIRCSWIL